MKMNSCFKGCLQFVVFFVSGCSIHTNIVSTSDFEYYVSDIKYMDMPCSELISIEKAFHGEGEKSDAVVANAIGIAYYKEKIPDAIVRMMIESNYSSLRYALERKGCDY